MIAVAIVLILFGLFLTLNHQKATRITGAVIAFVGLLIGFASL